MPMFDVISVFYTKVTSRLSEFYQDEELFVDFLSQFMIASAIITFFSFTFLDIRAMYGRYSSESLFANISIPAKIAWFLQELPSLLIPLFVIWQRGFSNIPFANSIALAMFIVHYFQRSLIYPWLIRGGKPTPIHLFLLGLIFTTWNGYIQGYFHTKYAGYQNRYFWTFGSLIGIFLFIIGMFINLHADYILRSLRRPGEKCYKIPHGGMFKYVSCANFFGEIIEWFGYAIYAQSTASFAFALFTAANTIPRAKSHHKWYLNKFGNNYPQNRKAVIPFIY